MDNDDMSADMNKELENNLRLYEEMRDQGKFLYLDSDDYINIINYYTDISMPEEALEAIEHALSIHPDEVSFFFLKAAIHSEQNQIEEARDAMSHIENKDSVAFRLTNINLLIQEQKLEEAINALNNITEEELREEDETLVLNLIELYFALELKKEALEWLLKISNWGSLPDEFLELIACFYVENGELESAYDIYNRLLDNNPYSEKYWIDQANVLHYLKRYEEALDACDFALISNEKSNVHLIKASSYIQLKNFEKAIEELKTADRKKNISRGNYLALMGFCYLSVKDLQTAGNFFRKALEVIDKESHVYLELLLNSAQCFIATGNFDEAFEVCKIMLKSFPDEEHVYIISGMFYIGNGNKKKGLKYWEKAVKISPEVSTYSQIGQICLDMKEYEISEGYLKKAEELDPGHENINRHLAIMYFHLQNVEKCRQYINKAMQESRFDRNTNEDDELLRILDELNLNY